MTKFNASIAAAAAALLLSGNAFAASLQPAAGEAPFADTAIALTSAAQRPDVRAAAGEMPASGELSAVALQAESASTLTRADVRTATINAIARGDHPALGQNS